MVGTEAPFVTKVRQAQARYIRYGGGVHTPREHSFCLLRLLPNRVVFGLSKFLFYPPPPPSPLIWFFFIS